MATSSTPEAEAACLHSLESALPSAELPDLTGFTADAVDSALQTIVKRHAAAAAPLVQVLAERAPAKGVRKAARRALYKLSQSGVALPEARAVPAGPVVKPLSARPVRAWLSGIDGTGSRAAWILFEGGLGGQLQLCSLILNDEAGILEVAGGAITRKRLATELRVLREHQKLPWVESDPGRAARLVAEALAIHAAAGTEPPPEFSRWRPFFPASSPAGEEVPPGAGDDAAALSERSVELLDLPELAGWFIDPGQIHAESLSLLQTRESRLVVSDQIKSEREAAIVDDVVDKVFTPEVRRRWARRLSEMGQILGETGREGASRLAAATAAALADDARAARHLPFARALATRGLAMGAEVALGRAKLADVSRAPVRAPRS